MVQSGSIDRLSPRELIWIEELRLAFNIPTSMPLSEALDLVIPVFKKPGSPELCKPDHKVYYILALYFEECWRNATAFEKDDWVPVYALKYWRLAGEPEHAVNISSEATEEKDWAPIIRSAFHTSRGAAFYALSNMEAALAEAELAISIYKKRYYPYNLKGAVLIRQGKIEEAENAFDIARQLIEPEKESIVSKEQDRILKGILESAEPRTVILIVNRLLKLDKNRYSWTAQYYLMAQSYVDMELLDKDKEHDMEEKYEDGVNPFFSEQEIDLVLGSDDEGDNFLRSKGFVFDNFEDDDFEE